MDTYSFKTSYSKGNYCEVPECFDNEHDGHARVVLMDTYGSLYPNGTNAKPLFYARHANNERGYRSGCVTEFGDGYLATQTTNGHHEDMAQKEAIVTPYVRIGEDDPVLYGYSSGGDKPTEYRFYADHATWKENDFLDVVATPYPMCVECHCVKPQEGLPQVTQPCRITGTYEGRPIDGLGFWDRVCMPQKFTHDVGSKLAYIIMYGAGVRPDGRFEIMQAHLYYDGEASGFYWLQDEEPIVSNNVTLDTEWVHLPYVDDGTLTYNNAVWHIGEKEIHFTGKWGTKGFTKEPFVEKHGQSQVFGTWYAGDAPYTHEIFTTFNEQMDAYDYNISKIGQKIID